MKIKKQLQKPENWQDFESLCKKLWGEIWQCPEIKKNGRSGQKQHGIDIYGIPFGEIEYYGIQCKGKDEYSHKQLTENEIDVEVGKAKSFEPPLKQMIFATTANKDANIESYVRKKNIEHIKNNLFEVHLFSWEDIVDLIEENRQTYNYYVKSKNYRSEQLAKLVFNNNEDSITINVPFHKKITRYELKKEKGEVFNPYDFLSIQSPKIDISVLSSPLFDNTINHSYCKFHFRLQNLGKEPIKEFKIFFEFNGKFKTIDTCNKTHPLIPNPNIKYDTFIWQREKQGKIVPLKNILVQEDSIAFDDIEIKPFPEKTEIEFNWKLVSLDYTNKGNLLLTINPEFKLEEETKYIIDPKHVRIEENIEDYITRG